MSGLKAAQLRYSAIRRLSDAEIDDYTAWRIERTLTMRETSARLRREAAERKDRAEHFKAARPEPTAAPVQETADPTLPRPKTLRVIDHMGRQATVSIDAHDDFYKGKRTWFKQRLAATHPDRKNGERAARQRQGIAVGPITRNGDQFQQIQKQYRAWMQSERVYYWRFALMPPNWKGAYGPPTHDTTTTRAVPRALPLGHPAPIERHAE
jgi:hypothetical protein